MAQVNKVQLIGNLGANPECKYTAKGNAVCNLRIATNRVYKDKEGKKHTDTQWHKVIVWGKQAESCKQYLSKGRQVYIEGRLQTRKWEDKDGNPHWITEVIAEGAGVQFLGGPQQVKSQEAPEEILMEEPSELEQKQQTLARADHITF